MSDKDLPIYKILPPEDNDNNGVCSINFYSDPIHEMRFCELVKLDTGKILNYLDSQEFEDKLIETLKSISDAPNKDI